MLLTSRIIIFGLVICVFSLSPGFSQTCVEPKLIVDHVFSTFLDRPPSESEAQYFASRLFIRHPDALTAKGFVIEIVTSQEYKQRFLDPLVIRGTYRRLLEREPSEMEYENAATFLKRNSAFEFFKSVAKSEEHFNVFLRGRSEGDAIRKLQQHIVFTVGPRGAVPPPGSPPPVSIPLLQAYRRSYREAVDFLMNGATYIYGRDCVPQASNANYLTLIDRVSRDILNQTSSETQLKDKLFSEGFRALMLSLVNSQDYQQRFGDSYVPGYASRLPICTENSPPPVYIYEVSGEITWELRYEAESKLLTDIFPNPLDKSYVAKLDIHQRTLNNGLPAHLNKAFIKFWPDNFPNMPADTREPAFCTINFRISQLPTILDQLKKAKKIQFFLTGVNPSSGTYIQYYAFIRFFDSAEGVPVWPN